MVRASLVTMAVISHISHCGKNGIHGSLGGIFSTIEGNTICDIAVRGRLGGPDIAGLKLLGSHDTLVRHNHIFRYGGAGGIWLDWMAQGARITGNLLHDNRRDLFVEVNHGPLLVDNNVFLSPGGILEASGGTIFVFSNYPRSFLHVERTQSTPVSRSCGSCRGHDHCCAAALRCRREQRPQ